MKISICHCHGIWSPYRAIGSLYLVRRLRSCIYTCSHPYKRDIEAGAATSVIPPIDKYAYNDNTQAYPTHRSNQS